MNHLLQVNNFSTLLIHLSENIIPKEWNQEIQTSIQFATQESWECYKKLIEKGISIIEMVPRATFEASKQLVERQNIRIESLTKNALEEKSILLNACHNIKKVVALASLVNFIGICLILSGLVRSLFKDNNEEKEKYHLFTSVGTVMILVSTVGSLFFSQRMSAIQDF
jgi:uncharacterized membrane protein